jgi:hypothetical protein
LHVAIKRLKQRKEHAMTQAELFSPTETVSQEAKAPDTIPAVMAMGYDNPKAANPYYWSSSFWEAFLIGQYLREKGLPVDGFRQSRGSSYVNRSGLVLKVAYDKRGGTASWAIIANR